VSTFLNRLSQSATTRVEIDSAFAGTPVYHDGLVYGAADVLVVNYAGTPAFYMAGIGFTAAGEMCVVDASAGLPADTIHQSGLPISRAESRLCVDPLGAVTYWHQGVPFTAVRAVAVDGASEGPGAFTFTAMTEAEGIVIDWTASAGATSYEIKREGILIHTEPVPGNLTWDDLEPAPTNSYTMFAINGSGTTASTSNPQVASYP